MKGLLVYFACAVVLGTAVIIAPLITFAGFRHEPLTPSLPWLNENIRGLEGYRNLGSSSSDISGFTILVVSFVISMIVYLYVRHRVPRPSLPWVRIPPF